MKKFLASLLSLIVVAVSSVAQGTGGPAQITLQPVSFVQSFGQPAGFYVAAWSTTFLTYQWYRNGVAIPGATNSSLILSSVNCTHHGFYKVAVINAAGPWFSNQVTLEVVP